VKQTSRGAVLLIFVIVLAFVGAAGYFVLTRTPAKTGIAREEAAQLIPLHPSQVLVEATAGAIELKWRGTGGDLLKYEVYRKAYNAEEWQQLTNVATTGDNKRWYEYRDTTIKEDSTYIYGVSAVGIYGKKSLISDSDAVTPK